MAAFVWIVTTCVQHMFFRCRHAPWLGLGVAWRACMVGSLSSCSQDAQDGRALEKTDAETYSG